MRQSGKAKRGLPRSGNNQILVRADLHVPTWVNIIANWRDPQDGSDVNTLLKRFIRREGDGEKSEVILHTDPGISVDQARIEPA
ncbi:hypothetical protein ACKI1Z_41595, partial [Streptomyces galilaeus]